MTILLLGKDGQLGHELQRALLPLGTVKTFDRSELDLSDPFSLKVQLELLQPKIIVNAAAFTAVDAAESHLEEAFAINATSVGLLANYSARHQALLVHYSTDYVFDGTKLSPYTEQDFPNPLNIYGLSKWAGEQAIFQHDATALIFRTSWVFSPFRSNFIKSMLSLAQKRTSLSVVDDQIGAPTSVELIADVTALAIHAYRFNQLPVGLYHLTASGCCSWHELAYHILARAQGNDYPMELKLDNLRPISSSDYPSSAQRPCNSCLSTQLLQQALQITLPKWQIYVERTVDRLTSKNL